MIPWQYLLLGLTFIFLFIWLIQSSFNESDFRIAKYWRSRIIAWKPRRLSQVTAKPVESSKEDLEKKTINFLPITPLRAIVSVAIAVGVYFLTDGWWGVSVLFFVAVMANPYLNTKNTQRQIDIDACLTVETFANNMVSIMGTGVSPEQAFVSALKNPNTAFEAKAEAILPKAQIDPVDGVLELKRQIKHSIGDRLCLTLHFIFTSSVKGAPADALKATSLSAKAISEMEQRILIKQKEGYFAAKATLYASLLIMLFQIVTASGDTGQYAVYESTVGQMIILALGMIMAMGVWLTIAISKGKSFLRISLKLD